MSQPPGAELRATLSSVMELATQHAAYFFALRGADVPEAIAERLTSSYILATLARTVVNVPTDAPGDVPW